MVTIKYQKKDSAQFISHIDLLKHMARIIRRANIPVKYSQGFNPHTLVFFSPPSVLGVASSAEYVSIDTNMDKNEVLTRFNSAVPESLKGLEAFEVPKNPNLQANVFAADFMLPIGYKNLDISNFVIKYTKKGQEIVEDVTDKIFGVYEYENKMVLRLAQGSSSLRPDRILSELKNRLNEEIRLTEIEKIAQYEFVGGKMTNVDVCLK